MDLAMVALIRSEKLERLELLQVWVLQGLLLSPRLPSPLQMKEVV